jgi:glycosyltransferase involved in cell wall biosynthesis
MKSICIVSPQFLPHVGGVEQYVDNFSKELVRRGNKVTIITSEIEGEKEYEEKDGVEIIRLDSYSLMNGRFPFLKCGKSKRKWTKKLRTKKYDVFLVNTRFYPLSLYGVRLAHKMKTRCILLDHGTSHLNTGNGITSKIGELYEHGITTLDKIFCKEYAGVSGAVLEWLKHFHIKSDTVLYNSIDVEQFEEKKKNIGRSFRKEYNIPENATVISFVGRLTKEKGIEELEKAVKRINQTRNDVYLIAAGDGYLKEKMENNANDNIFFTGNLCKDDVVALLCESDIFCLPSVSEGFPTTVLEAAVCDNYIVSTYRGGTRELIKDESYGLILPDNEWKALSRALENLIDRKDYLKEAAKKTHKEVSDKYTWKYTVGQFLELL